MAISAMAIPVQTLPLSKIVVDADLNMGSTYRILTKIVQAVPGQSLYLVDSGSTYRVCVNYAGLYAITRLFVDHISEYTVSHGIALEHPTNPPIFSKSYTGNSGTEVFQRLFPAIEKAVMTGTTLTNMGLKLRIPDTNLPGADLKFTCKMKSGGAYAASCEIYKNGVGTSSVASTTGTHTTLQERPFTTPVPVAAGDYIEFFCVNANAVTTTQLYEISIIGDVTLSGVVNDESDTPLGLA